MSIFLVMPEGNMDLWQLTLASQKRSLFKKIKEKKK